SLGLKMPQPTLDLAGVAVLIAGFVLASRLLTLVPLSWATGKGLRMGILTGLNLAQISEFSLVILSLGAAYGHVSPRIHALVLVSMLLTSVLATYVIHFNQQLAGLFLAALKRVAIRERGQVETQQETHSKHHDIVVLGCFREGEALLDVIAERAPELRS